MRRTLLAQAERIGHDHLVLMLAFGDLGHASEMTSPEPFRTAVMPGLAPLNEGA